MRLTVHTERGTFVGKKVADEDFQLTRELLEKYANGADHITLEIDGGCAVLSADLLRTAVFVLEREIAG